MKKLLLLTLLIFSGCAHTQVQPSTTSWLDSFRPSGSFCLDAYSVNSASAGCVSWSSRMLPGGVMEMRCSDYPESETGPDSIWLSSTFIFYGNGSETPPLRYQALCSDVNGVFGVLVSD